MNLLVQVDHSIFGIPCDLMMGQPVSNVFLPSRGSLVLVDDSGVIGCIVDHEHNALLTFVNFQLLQCWNNLLDNEPKAETLYVVFTQSLEFFAHSCCTYFSYVHTFLFALKFPW